MRDEQGYWRTFAGRRRSRRRLMQSAAGAALGAATLGLVGCGDDDTDTDAPRTAVPNADGSTPKRGGTLRQGSPIGIVDLDVHVQPLGTQQHVTGRIYSHIMKLTRDIEVVADLGETLEQPETTTYVWKVRQGVKFQNIEPVNGRPVISEDFKNSVQRMMDEPTEYVTFFKNLIVSMETPDDKTFILKTKEPSAPLLTFIANPHVGVFPKEVLAAWGDLKTKAIGSGPYIVDTFREAEKVILKRNPDYWEKDLPYADQMEWTIIPDQAALRAAFKSKQMDVNAAALTVPLLEEIKGPGVEILETPLLSTWFYWFGQVDEPPFKDPRVRLAFSKTIDRQEIINRIAFGKGKVTGPVPWGHERFALPQDYLEEQYKVDIADAKKLMEAAGYADGFDLVHTTVPSIQGWVDHGLIVQEQLKQIGVRMTFDNTELGDFLANRLFKADFKSMLLGTNPYEEPDEFLSYYHSDGRSGLNWSKFGNPEIDKLIEKERQELEPEARQSIFQDVQKLMVDNQKSAGNVSQLALWAGIGLSAFHDYVKNKSLALGISEAYVYDMWLDT